MPQLLDSLLIELGLDASQFDRGSKEASRSLGKVKDEVDKHSKEIQKSVGEGISEAFRTATRHALEFIAAMAGAYTIQQFTANVTTGATQLGILATALGMSPQRISSIQLAVERAGGSAQDATAALSAMQNIRYRAQTEGTIPSDMMRLGVDVMGSKGPEDLLNRTIDAMSKSNWGRSLTNSQKITLLQGLGVPMATATLYVERGVAGAGALINEASKDAITPGQLKAFTQLYSAWVGVSQAVISVGREIVRVITPAMLRLINYVGQLIELNGPAIEKWFGTQVKEWVDWLTDPATWKDVKDTYDACMKEVQKWVDKMGGWTEIGKGLAVIFALSVLSPALEGIAALTTAFTALGRASIFTKALGWLAIGFGIVELRKFIEGGGFPHHSEEENARSRIRGYRMNSGQDPDAPISDEEIRKEIEHGHLPWYKKLFPGLFGGSENKELPLATTEGDVGKSNPLPVKPVTRTSTMPMPVGSSPSVSGATQTVVDKGTPSQKTITAPMQAPSRTPRSAYGASRPYSSAQDAAKGGHFRLPGYYDPDGSDTLPPVHHSSIDSGARLAMSRLSSPLRGGTSGVKIAALNIHGGSSSPTQGPDWFNERISRDFYALRSDVGLA